MGKAINLQDMFLNQVRKEGIGVTIYLTNSVQRNNPDTSFTSSTFGQLPKAQFNFPRVIQLAGKFYF